MKNVENYKRGYYMPPNPTYRWAEKEYVDKAPIWCSVDLRDGNQSLIIPMSLEEKLEFFSYLVKLGFKEIEIGFPASNDTEYELTRALIERNLIPDDVTIQVLTQSREHIIKKTFEALEGCKSAIVHLYNSTSVAQREQVFKKSKEEIKEIAVFGAKLCEEYRQKTKGNFKFEYSPESFTGTEPEYALEVCNAVLDVWKPTPENKVIINLPVTVAMSMSHVYATQVEYMSDNLKYRENVIVSLHPHNDRGCAVADSELGLLAGGDRIEGTLFGNGERTGNVDIVTLAMNMFSHGVDPELDFTDLPTAVELYERVTRMHVYERQPYSGELVFTAFSGSHQDAIAKGMKYREDGKEEFWTVPYLPINPLHVGRQYEGDVIRINSQSGKGGIGYLLEQKYGYDLPPKMREAFGYIVKGVSDRGHRELKPDEVYEIFKESFLNKTTVIDIPECHFVQKKDGSIAATATVVYNGKENHYVAQGNGSLDAVSNAIKQIIDTDFAISIYKEHALERGSHSKAVAYVGIEYSDGKTAWGAGIHTDIITASVSALVSAVNNMDN